MTNGQNKSGLLANVNVAIDLEKWTLTISLAEPGSGSDTTLVTGYAYALGVIVLMQPLARTLIRMGRKIFWFGLKWSVQGNFNGMKNTKRTSDRPTEPINSVLKN